MITIYFYSTLFFASVFIAPKIWFKLGLCIAFLSGVFIADAQVKPFSIFTDNMVLQREVEVPIWGTASGCKTVTIQYNGQTIMANVVNDKWIAKFSPMKANSAPLDMLLSCEKNQVVLHNVVVGEVWLAGGQSNMERQLGLRKSQKPILNWEEEAAAANYPNIREFSLPRNSNAQVVVSAINAQWKVCNPTNVINFSAVAYFFAQQIHVQYNIPIGIIHSSWGGTNIERWMRKELLLSNPDFATVLNKYNEAVASYPEKLAVFNDTKESLKIKWIADSTSAIIASKPLPTKPSAPDAPSDPNPMHCGEYGALYKTMIEPLMPYAMKGVIWYQGESNSRNPDMYAKLFPAMIKDWREQWKIGEFPFLFVQIAPFRADSPELREAQLFTALHTPKTAMVVTIDCGDSNDIHPTNKKPVGQRLALAARALAYHEKETVYSGPMYKSFKVKHNAIAISFTHIGQGLKANGDSLIGFSISANGKDFVDATALIHKNKVVVSSPAVVKPVAVRYAFVKNPVGNLFNKDGLPASPFRTDITLTTNK
jgi:sialate O-acetylesterase